VDGCQRDAHALEPLQDSAKPFEFLSELHPALPHHLRSRVIYLKPASSCILEMSSRDVTNRLRERVWNGSIPLEIRLQKEDCRTYHDSDPYLVCTSTFTMLRPGNPHTDSFMTDTIPTPLLPRPPHPQTPRVLLAEPHFPRCPSLRHMALLRRRAPKMALPPRPPLRPLLGR
jgi:hypothetical protein